MIGGSSEELGSRLDREAASRMAMPSCAGRFRRWMRPFEEA